MQEPQPEVGVTRLIIKGNEVKLNFTKIVFEVRKNSDEYSN
jgi:hypothetical protein